MTRRAFLRAGRVLRHAGPGLLMRSVVPPRFSLTFRGLALIFSETVGASLHFGVLKFYNVEF